MAWSAENNIIVSSGEDHKYKIWDAQGANMFASSAEEFSITSLSFCPVKNLIAIGGFNNLKLCDLSGVSFRIYIYLRVNQHFFKFTVGLRKQDIQRRESWITAKYSLVS